MRGVYKVNGLDFRPLEGVRFSGPPVMCAKERGRTKRLEIEPTK